MQLDFVDDSADMCLHHLKQCDGQDESQHEMDGDISASKMVPTHTQ